MSRVDITDDMVERALKAWPWKMPEIAPSCCRKMLEAALSPAEPEIPVTEAMTDAAHGLYAQHGAYIEPCSWTVGGLSVPQVAKLSSAIYRAMESVRRKAEKPRKQYVYDDGITRCEHSRAGDHADRCHRRKGDPK